MLWDAGTGKEIAVLRGHESLVKFAAFSADGSRIVTASHDRIARISDFQSPLMASLRRFTSGCCVASPR
ncbi:MAG: WD40 repeat domain-containing protein [Xanthobacteraceae bacterium]